MVKRIKTCCLLLLTSLVLAGQVPGEDWQHCKPEEQYSFVELKSLVRSATTMHGYSGWHVKGFERAGDLTAVAVLQTLSDAEMASPDTLNDVLLMLQMAFECPRCILVIDDQQPRITLLLLDHLQHGASRGMKRKIEETKRSIIKQANSTK